MRARRILRLFIVIALISPPACTSASQVYGHLYYADDLLAQKPVACITLNEETKGAFLLGSLGPDAAWIAHMMTNPAIRARLAEKYQVRFPSRIRSLPGSFDDVHQIRPIELTLRFITLADSPVERAYALGWTSHFVADTYIHHLINQHGGFVKDAAEFEDPAMKRHDFLEALEMRHVLQLQPDALLANAMDARKAKMPLQFLRRTLALTYRENSYYRDYPKDFAAAFGLGQSLMLDSTRWYGYQSTHSPNEIARTKKLLKRFRPQQGKILEVLTDLPAVQQYRAMVAKDSFMAQWNQQQQEIKLVGRQLLETEIAYYWWKDRHSNAGMSLSEELYIHLERQLRGINPENNLMQPRKIANSNS